MSVGHVLVIIVVVTIFQGMVSEAKLAEVLARARITTFVLFVQAMLAIEIPAKWVAIGIKIF